MSIEVKVPVLPESVADATIANWHKKVGDAVKRDENLVDLETDKVVLEVPAPADGVIREILRKEGDTVASQEVLAIIEEGAVAAAAPASEAPAQPAAPARSTGDGPAMSPAAQRMASQHGVDPAGVSGTGRDGRIIKEDVQRAL